MQRIKNAIRKLLFWLPLAILIYLGVIFAGHQLGNWIADEFILVSYEQKLTR